MNGKKKTLFQFNSHYSVLCRNGSTLCNENCIHLQNKHIMYNVLLTYINKIKTVIYYELHFVLQYTDRHLKPIYKCSHMTNTSQTNPCESLHLTE